MKRISEVFKEAGYKLERDTETGEWFKNDVLVHEELLIQCYEMKYKNLLDKERKKRK